MGLIIWMPKICPYIYFLRLLSMMFPVHMKNNFNNFSFRPLSADDGAIIACSNVKLELPAKFFSANFASSGKLKTTNRTGSPHRLRETKFQVERVRNTILTQNTKHPGQTGSLQGSSKNVHLSAPQKMYVHLLSILQFWPNFLSQQPFPNINEWPDVEYQELFQTCLCHVVDDSGCWKEAGIFV